jgi:hypothetical protein
MYKVVARQMELFNHLTWLQENSCYWNKYFMKELLALCQSSLNPYCLGRKAAFFSVGI